LHTINQNIEFDVDFPEDDYVAGFQEVATLALAPLGSLFTAAVAVKKYASETLSKSEQIKVQSGDLTKQKLGFMNEVKNELTTVGEMLKNPTEKVPTLLNYLLQESWLPLVPARVRKWLLPSKMLPCRLVIYVDDLDRCPPKKAVEVLQSLVLLTEGTPFVIFLAIDPRSDLFVLSFSTHATATRNEYSLGTFSTALLVFRVVVAAIEASESSFYGTTGINGSEYLDKVSLPDLSL